MSAPNRFDAVVAIRDSFPHLFRLNSIESAFEACQRVVKLANQGDPKKPWGLTRKDGGEKGFYPSGFSFGGSHDAITWLPDGDMNRHHERWQYDIVAGAGSGKPANPAWGEVPQHEYRAGNVWLREDTFPQSVVTGDRPVTRCDLYTHWFPLIRSLNEFSEHARNFSWITQPEHKPVGFRFFGDVDGERFKRDGVSPWRDAGLDWRWPHYRDWFKRTRDMMAQHSLMGILTLHGGRAHFNGWDDQRRYYDGIREDLVGFEPFYRYIEDANEFAHNGWSEGEIQRAGQYLRSIFGDSVDIALSSPEGPHTFNETATKEQMRASFDALYGGADRPDHFGASVCTVHVMRVSSKWGDPANYTALIDLPVASNEDRAPNSYLGVNDVATLRNDAFLRRQAGCIVYCPVFGWGVFNGHIDQTVFGGHRNLLIEDEPNADAIFKAWKEVLEQGGDAPQPVPIPKPPVSAPTYALLPGQSLLPGQVLRSGEYGLTLQPDGNIVTYGPVPGAGHWESHTAGNTDVVNLQMQEDGNLVLYAAEGLPIWSTGTNLPGAMVQLQGDGNFVMYHEGTPVWASADHP